MNEFWCKETNGVEPETMQGMALFFKNMQTLKVHIGHKPRL